MNIDQLRELIKSDTQGLLERFFVYNKVTGETHASYVFDTYQHARTQATRLNGCIGENRFGVISK